MSDRRESLLDADHSKLAENESPRSSFSGLRCGEKVRLSELQIPGRENKDSKPLLKTEATREESFCSRKDFGEANSGRTFGGTAMMFDEMSQFPVHLSEQPILKLLQLEQSIDIIQHSPGLHVKALFV